MTENVIPFSSAHRGYLVERNSSTTDNFMAISFTMREVIVLRVIRKVIRFTLSSATTESLTKAGSSSTVNDT